MKKNFKKIMKIYLKNFRCYLDSQFDLGESGIVLISAPSGKGKTTILMAIQFVLFGTGKKVVTYDKTSCSVQLEYLEYLNTTITRTKTPNRLILKNSQGTFEGDSAQSIINKIFGDHFNLTSCISQNSYESFILLSPMDKLEFLEKFAFQDVDIAVVNKKCKDIIKEKETEMLKITTQINTMNSIFEYTSIPEKINFPLKCSMKNRPIAIKNEYTRFKNTEILLKKHKETLETSTNEYHRLQLQEQRIDIKKTELKHIESKIDLITFDENKIQELENSIKSIKNHKMYLEYKKNLDNLNNSKLSEMNEYTNTVETLKSNLWPLQSKEDTETTINDYKKVLKSLEKIQLLNLEKYQYSDEFQDYTTCDMRDLLEKERQQIVDLEQCKDIYTCPNCSSFLKFQKKTLIVSTNSNNIASVDVIDSKISEIKKNINKMETELKIRQKNEENNLKIQAIHDESVYNLEDISSIDDFSLDLKNLKTYYYENTSNETKLEEIQLKIQNRQYSTIILNTEKELKKSAPKFVSVEFESLPNEQEEAEIQKELHELYQQKTKLDELLTAKKTCLAQLCLDNNVSETSDQIFELIKTLKTTVSELETQHQKAKENIELIEKYKTYEKEQIMYDEMVLKIQTAKNQEKIISKELSSACILKQLILEAESISVLNIINSINTHAQGFLDTFFDDPISIRLIPFKETKGGNKKPQINVEVHYKGMEAELSMLSGGELSRVVLAFMLALVEIFNSPIVLLDECTSSLDENLNTEVIESIKTTFQKKLIIMISHQCVAGNYDKIIEL